MTCEHEFNYFGDQKGANASARYFKCIKCGTVKVRSEDGNEYLVPGTKQEDSE
jgi:hypothetical protein